MNRDVFKINFDTNFDCVICLNTSLPEIEIFEKLAGIPIIAADGAAHRLNALNITPDYIIGDLDSFKINEYKGYISEDRIIHLPDQNTNDFEKILVFAKNSGWNNIIILGFHGGELEHTFNNWSVLMKFVKPLNLCIYDKSRYGIPVNFSLIMPTKLNEIISLIPQPYAKLKTKGLEWQLENEFLALGLREGARNRANKPGIMIQLTDGELLLFCDDRLPYAPSKTSVDFIVNL